MLSFIFTLELLFLDWRMFFLMIPIFPQRNLENKSLECQLKIVMMVLVETSLEQTEKQH